MPAKSFIGEIGETARRFYATAVRGEVSDATVRGYLRAASQIEDVWGQIDQQLAALIGRGVPAWEAYARLRYPLAFIRAARTYQVFVQELLAADAAADPAAGYLPQDTFDQANALCHQIQPNLQHAIAALSDPSFRPEVTLPLTFGPRIECESASCPVAHLEGVIAATREVRDWASGLIAEYSAAVSREQGPVPANVTSHITLLDSRLAQADSQFRFGTDLIGQISRGEATAELHEQGENDLWDALRGYFLLNQAVAMPEALQAPDPSAQPAGAGRPHRVYRDRPLRPSDLWRIAAPSARSELRRTKFGRDEMEEMCKRMGGMLSADAQQYLHDAEAAVARGDAVIIAAMANCPFEPLYRARRPLDIAGVQVPARHEFHWNFYRGHIESARRFGRVNDWRACEE